MSEHDWSKIKEADKLTEGDDLYHAEIFANGALYEANIIRTTNTGTADEETELVDEYYANTREAVTTKVKHEYGEDFRIVQNYKVV